MPPHLVALVQYRRRQTILRGLGYPVNGRREAWYVWNLVRHHLRERRTLFLHLDEAQDLAARGTERERHSVVNLLKSLMQDPEWPVGLILSGTGELADILNFDPQLGRRFQPIRFDPVSEIADLEKVRDLLSAYVAKTAVFADDGIETEEFQPASFMRRPTSSVSSSRSRSPPSRSHCSGGRRR